MRVDKHPEINAIDIKTTLEKATAFIFGWRPPADGKLLGNEMTKRADADKI